jgi:hypothetical protein
MPGAERPLAAVVRDQRGRLIEVQIAIALFLMAHAIFIPHLADPAPRRRLIGHVVLTVVWLGIAALAAAVWLPSRVTLGLSATVWTYLVLALLTFWPLLGVGAWPAFAALPLQAALAIGLECGLAAVGRRRPG